MTTARQNLVEQKPDLINAKIQKSVMAYYDDLKPNSQYIRDVSGVIKQANKYLNSCIKKQKNLITKNKLAIVLDIDDTSVSNYPLIVKDSFVNTQDKIILRYRNSTQPAIKPVLDFTNKAINKGVSVFFITYRKPHDNNPTENLRPYTIKTLEHAGYKEWSDLYLPKEEELKFPSTQFKIDRRKAISEEGYRIVLNIGDQPSDLAGGFAEQTFKLPNYLYPVLGFPEGKILLEENKPEIVEDVSEIEMAKSTFGRNSHTTKKLELTSPALFNRILSVKEDVLDHMLDAFSPKP